MNSMIGGESILDAPRLPIQDVGQAEDFLRSYGYRWDAEKDRRTVYSYYRQAIAFLQDRYAVAGQDSISEMFDKNGIKDVRDLLVMASVKDTDRTRIQKWCCATLKVMHVMAHLSNDLYSNFENEIRDQILQPFQTMVSYDSIQNMTLLQNEHESIRLNKFEIKPIKNQSSAVLKLLAKRNLVALNILDRVGVRFVTKNTFEIYKVLRFMINNALVSYPNSISNESVNTVYPTNLFLEVMDTLRSKGEWESSKMISDILDKKLLDSAERAEFQNKENKFTDPEYKFVKFISRKLIRIEVERKGKFEMLQFFYPFEVQIMNYETYLKNMRGPLSHEEYKKRQEIAARERLALP